jgi:hypothetical protein
MKRNFKRINHCVLFTYSVERLCLGVILMTVHFCIFRTVKGTCVAVGGHVAMRFSVLLRRSFKTHGSHLSTVFPSLSVK